VVPDRFDLDDLLRGIADSESPSMAQQALVKTLMAIDYLPTATEKVRQLGDRIELLRAFETQVHARIVSNPELRGRPMPPVPPPSVAGEFQVLMAIHTALQKLGETRAALMRRLS
jgi:hypothetical protein